MFTFPRLILIVLIKVRIFFKIISAFRMLMAYACYGRYVGDYIDGVPLCTESKHFIDKFANVITMPNNERDFPKRVGV